MNDCKKSTPDNLSTCDAGTCAFKFRIAAFRTRRISDDFYRMVSDVNAGPPPPSILAVPARPEPMWCPQCGQVEKCDEDGCCAMCGATIISEQIITAIVAKAQSQCEQSAHELKLLGALAVIKRLRGTIAGMQTAAERRNRALDALHWVWCSGGCETGVHRFCGHPDEVTEDVVATLEREAKRLRAWYTTRQAKKGGQNG